ncbi:MAG TPA: phospholipase D-like domain-containing protein [bacterium]|nr:phospholipase D-like domain-containing protein [bacterium]
MEKKEFFIQKDLYKSNIFCIGRDGLFRNALISAVDEAKEVVLAASFLFTDEKLSEAFVNAYERGVRVYVLSASETSLKNLGGDVEDFSARMAEEHAKFMDRIAGKALLRSAAHFHAKFLLVDPDYDFPKGYISTANFNKALTDSVELGIELSQQQTNELASWFSYVFWKESEHELLERGRLSRVKEPPAEPVEPLNEKIQVTTRNNKSLRTTIQSILEAAEKEIIISSFGIEKENLITELLVRKAKEGVAVTILTRPRPAVSEAVKLLESAGACVIAHEKLHAKALVTEKSAMIFTANIQAHGLDTGFETGVILSEDQRISLREILVSWKDIFPWHFANSASPKDHLGKISLADSSLKEGVLEVIKDFPVILGDIIADSVLSFDKTADPEFKAPHIKNFPQQITYTWTVKPPTLPLGAVEKFENYSKEITDDKGSIKIVTEKRPFIPPVFEHKGKAYVVVEKESDIEKATLLSEKFKAKVVVK